jgi:hypothetical protein
MAGGTAGIPEGEKGEKEQNAKNKFSAGHDAADLTLFKRWPRIDYF